MAWRLAPPHRRDRHLRIRRYPSCHWHNLVLRIVPWRNPHAHRWYGWRRRQCHGPTRAQGSIARFNHFDDTYMFTLSEAFFSGHCFQPYSMDKNAPITFSNVRLKAVDCKAM
jgi:hypothetical protein